MTAVDASIAGDAPDWLVDCSKCLFCGGDRASAEIDGVRDFFFQADPGEFSLKRCGSCSSLWVQQRPFGDRLLAAYSQYYPHDEPAGISRARGLRGRLRKAYIDCRFGAEPTRPNRILAGALRLTGKDMANVDEYYRFAPGAPAKILDYGCGNGAYLLRMQPFGHSLYGAEYDPHLLGDLKRRGIMIEDVTAIDEHRWEQEFDHITLGHVIEHVPEPDALLQRLFRWLRPGGSLFVEVPNADATGLSIFEKYWRGLEAPRHFSLPSRTALVAAFERAGFTLDRQHINRSARRWVWQESLDAVNPDDRPSLQAAMRAAPAENENNAEFLTFLVRRPAA